MRFRALLLQLQLAAVLFVSKACSIELDVGDQGSIKIAAQQAALKLRALYPNGESWFIPGEFGKIRTVDGTDKGYYWWEAGAAMGAWIDYWHYTQDPQFNALVTEALLHQVGPSQNYEPPNHTLSLGNDDQAFWGIAAMSAAERAFPDPPSDKPQWLALAQAVFNRQAGRWDTGACGGGLRWQVVRSNKGYDYKNSISNGLLFHLAARLARYTGNQTYTEWAEKVYQWSMDTGLIDKDNYRIFDGAHIPECTVSSKIQWSYNTGVFLSGAAYLWNATSSPKWQNETEKLLAAATTNFFTPPPSSIMQEPACEFGANPPISPPTCNTDQRSFKAYLSRFLSQTYQLAPFTRSAIISRLRPSALAAAKSCTGGADGNTCGLSWVRGSYDGSPFGIAVGGVGEHMAAMEVIQSLMVPFSNPPVTAKDGGTSKGDPAAGTGKGPGAAGSGKDGTARRREKSTVGDRAGAGILTAVVLGGMGVLTWWLIRS